MPRYPPPPTPPRHAQGRVEGGESFDNRASVPMNIKAVDRERRIAPGRDPLAPTFVDVPPVSVAAMQQDDRRRGDRPGRTSQVSLQRMRTRQRRFEFNGGAAGLRSSHRTCERMSDQECTCEDSDFGELHHAPLSSLYGQPPAKPTYIPKIFRALAFNTLGRISSRMSSLAKSASQRSGVITGQSEPNSILSCKMELM